MRICKKAMNIHGVRSARRTQTYLHPTNPLALKSKASVQTRSLLTIRISPGDDGGLLEVS